MPYLDAEGRPFDAVPLLYRGERRFQLERGFTWVDPRDGSRVEVPRHDVLRPATDRFNSTDLASVPPFLWGLVASYGRQTLPAILHDALVDQADQAPEGEQLARRRVADERFRIALLEAGVPLLRSTAMWATVALEAQIAHRRILAVLLIAHVVVAGAALVAAVVLALLGAPFWLLLLPLPALTALVWGRDARVVVAGAYLGALYAPLIAAAFAASVIEYAVAVLAWLGGGTRGPAPRPGPTLRLRSR